MKPWREVAIPHKDIREGKVEENSFMVDFASVINGDGLVEYRDSQTFAAHTFPTQGLVNLLAAVVGRLAGTQPGEAVIELQTPFGGGKTHALVALYHIFKGHNLPSEFLQPILEKSKTVAIPPTKVVTFAGQKEDALKGKTPWGHIAAQLGRYDLVKDHDSAKKATGTQLLHEVLGPEPTLLLMDEILAYALKADFQAQLLIFFQELAETVSQLPSCTLVYTLPTNQPYKEEGERLLRDLKQVLGRVKAIHVPVEGQEVYEIIRRRLFEGLGRPAQREQTIENYWQLYRKMSDGLPPETQSLVYRERMLRAYPFHPQIIDLLYERWGSFYNFQRTRGVLQFLARVVADLWQAKDCIDFISKAPLIHAAHLNLRNDQIKGKLLENIGNEYSSTINQDIVNGNAKAQLIDDGLNSEYHGKQVASSLATAIFFGSFSEGERKGLNKRELQLALLRDGLPVSTINTALDRLEKELWYLHVQGGLYYFTKIPNPYRVILDQEDSVKEESIDAEVKKRLEKLSKIDEEIKVLIFQWKPELIEDKTSLQLVVLREEYLFGAEETTNLVEELLNKHSGEAGRIYRNALFLLAPDEEWLTKARNQCRRTLALRTVNANHILTERWTEEDKKRYKKEEHEVSGSLDDLLLKTYHYLARAGGEGGKAIWCELEVYPRGEPIKSLAQAVLKRLRADEILLKTIKPNFILEKVWPTDETEVLFDDLYKSFFSYPALPILEGPDGLWEAVRKGVSEGLFGLRVEGELLFKKSTPVNCKEDAILVAAEVAEAELRANEPEPVDAEGQAFSTPESAQRRAKKTTPLTLQMLSDADAEGLEVLPSRPVPVKRLTLRLRVSANSISEFSKGILNPLKKEAEVELEVSIVANSNTEITRTTLNSIEESIAQNKIEVIARREN